MEIFLGVKNVLRLVGFLQIEHPYRKAINVMQNIIHISCLTMFFSSSTYFLITKIAERSELSLYFNVAIFFVNLYISMMYKRQEIMTLITILEERIQQRMYYVIGIC